MLLSMATLLFACEEDKETGIPVLAINEADRSLSFESVGGTKTVLVTASTEFTATVESGKTWISTYVGGNVLRITTEASSDLSEREAGITVHVDGATDVTVRVSQNPYIPPVASAGKWTVAAPGNMEWYKWSGNKSIGTPASGAPATTAGPGNKQAWTLAKEDHVKITNPLVSPSKVYTLLWDIRSSTLSGYRPLLQTKTDNNDGDGDIFINGKRVGLGSYSTDVLTENTWHRIIVSVDAAAETKQAIFYVDGVPVLTKSLASASDADRYTLQNIFWVFLDDDNEDNPIDCAGIAVWDTNLSPGEIIRLGTVEEPIP
jgi:hypothetical protein